MGNKGRFFKQLRQTAKRRTVTVKQFRRQEAKRRRFVKQLRQKAKRRNGLKPSSSGDRKRNEEKICQAVEVESETKQGYSQVVQQIGSEMRKRFVKQLRQKAKRREGLKPSRSGDRKRNEKKICQAVEVESETKNRVKTKQFRRQEAKRGKGVMANYIVQVESKTRTEALQPSSSGRRGNKAQQLRQKGRKRETQCIQKTGNEEKLLKVD